MYNEKIINAISGEEIIRPYTEEEIIEVQKSQAEAQALIIAETEKANARKALLDKLGITEDEARLLLGGVK